MTWLEEAKQSLTELSGANEFTETIEVPGPLIPAISSNRPELLKIVAEADPVGKPYIEVIRVLMETNRALQKHCNLVAQGVKNCFGGLRGSLNTMENVSRFANFQELYEGDE